MNTKALHNITCGLYLLSSKSGEKTGGCIINTVMQVTSKPLRITVTVNKANFTHDMIAESGVFAVSLLNETAPFGLFQHFGFQSGRDVDKWKDLNAAYDEKWSAAFDLGLQRIYQLQGCVLHGFWNAYAVPCGCSGL